MVIRNQDEGKRLQDATLSVLDDSGAKTLRLYLRQVQYAAFLCVQMLRDASRIQAVIPEGGEDVVAIRGGTHELYQIKTRGESVGLWTLREALAVICRQYSLRESFGPACTFHFVSDQGADPKEKPRGLPGPLFRLKDVLRRRGALDAKQTALLQEFEVALCPIIVETLTKDHDDVLKEEEALDLLHRTRIQTGEPRLREYNWPGELQSALSERLPGHTFDYDDLLRTQGRIQALIVDRTINEPTVEGRTIRREDVMGCCQPSGSATLPASDWDVYPGKNRMEQKCHAGGFGPERIRNFARRKLLTRFTLRELDVVGRSADVDHLATYLSEKQRESLEDAIAAGHTAAPGPAALRLLRGELASAVRRYFPAGVPEGHDDDFAEGLLWRETERCYLDWGVSDAQRAA